MQRWDKGNQPGGRSTGIWARMVRLQGNRKCSESKTRERKVSCGV